MRISSFLAVVAAGWLACTSLAAQQVFYMRSQVGENKQVWFKIRHTGSGDNRPPFWVHAWPGVTRREETPDDKFKIQFYCVDPMHEINNGKNWKLIGTTGAPTKDGFLDVQNAIFNLYFDSIDGVYKLKYEGTYNGK